MNTTVLLLILGAATAQGELYDRNPEHLWNRLHHTLFVRRAIDGKEYGRDELEPLLWSGTKYLLRGDTHTNAIAVLDEFISSHGEELIRDPLKRAILQRDLWAVFGWAAATDGIEPKEGQARHKLEARLAKVIRQVALTKNQIERLQDNYTAAVASRKFAPDYDEKRPNTPFLPPELFAKDGAWVCVGINGSGAVAPTHQVQFGGRSAFLIFMKMPGGRQQAIQYLEQLRSFPNPWMYKVDTRVWVNAGTQQATSNQPFTALNMEIPQFPNGTTFALVRQMILVDDQSELVATHLTESVQIRRYNDVHPKPGAYGMSPPESQSVFEFLLTREGLFGGVSGGLRAVGADEKGFLHFMSKGFDAFEGLGERDPPRQPGMHKELDCMQCHSGPGLHSVQSFTWGFRPQQVFLPSLADLDADRERQEAIHWKRGKFDWGLLKGLWMGEQ